MKKDTGKGRAVQRLALRKEIIRNLDLRDLGLVRGGQPQCLATRCGNTTHPE